MENNVGNVNHLYHTLEDMLVDSPCGLHESSQGCQCCCDGASPTLGVTGSPCNPYSTRRAKRFCDDSISAHSMTSITMDSVIKFYTKYEPHTGITEQVTGFGMRTSRSVETSPLDSSLGVGAGPGKLGPGSGCSNIVTSD